MGKNLEKIIKTRLNNELDSQIPKHQFGFRQNASTIHPLIIMTSNIQTNNIIGNKSGAIYLDLTKAFDSVWHKGLLFKLHHSNCPNYILWFLKDFLEGRKSKIKINNSYSSLYENEQGVPQGSPLSPILFNIFCHDITNNHHQTHNVESYLLQFADDVAWVAHAKTTAEMINALQSSTNETIQWCNNWRLKINPDKSQLIIFNHNISDTSPTLQISNHRLRPLTSVKYLGIKLDQKLNFNSHTKEMKKKMITRVKHFRSLTYKNQGISTKTASKIYKMICRPIMEYGFILYNTCKRPALNNIEVAERSSLRKITKLRHPNNPLHNISNNALYEKTGIQPILTRFKELTKKCSQSQNLLALIQPFTIQLRGDIIRRRRNPERTLIELITGIRSSRTMKNLIGVQVELWHRILCVYNT